MTQPIAQPMRAQTCPTCAMPFSFPLDFYLARVKDNTAIHCPAGHEIRLTAISPATKSDLVEVCRQLRAELMNVRNGIAETKADAKKSPEGLVDTAELKRRCQTLAYSAERGGGFSQRFICRFCGKGYPRESGLRNHLRRQHPLEVSDLAASTFD